MQFPVATNVGVHVRWHTVIDVSHGIHDDGWDLCGWLTLKTGEFEVSWHGDIEKLSNIVDAMKNGLYGLLDEAASKVVATAVPLAELTQESGS